jgi:hypothetical protein
MTCRNKNFTIFEDFFPFNSKDKIIIVLNLNIKIFFYNLNDFFFLKKNGLSFLFKSLSVYQKSFLVLCNLGVLPVIDGKLDRLCYGFRPFRKCKDVFLEVNNYFSKKQLVLWIFKFNVIFSMFNINWLIKFFPFNKNLLNFILLKKEYKFAIKDNIIFFSTLFNYLLNGLV